MISRATLLAISVAYVAVLFGVAWFGDRRARLPPRGPRHALIYSLALSIYCTSWTFYGAVGRARSSGWDFLPIYLGPACVFVFGYPLLQRIVRISKGNNITSVADFIGARYGRHRMLPMTVTVVAAFGIVPYIALQLKAVSFGFDVLVGETGAVSSPQAIGAQLAVAAVMAIFAVLFGTRELSATENHHGMVLAMAFESLIKLLAFVAVGVLALTLIGGPGFHPGRIAHAAALPASAGQFGISFWTQTALAAFAILCLPRQFHIAVVEHAGPSDLKTARTVFPIYLAIVSVFVIPIAEAGRQVFSAPVSPDTFVLALPLALGHPWLGLVAYVGGFSAATGMVIVETIAIATMISNEIVMPILLRGGRLSRAMLMEVPRVLQRVRRVCVVGVISLSYLYYLRFTAQGSLAQIGLLSFAGVAQFAPSLVGGVFWRGGSWIGACAGIIAGALLWAYTLLLPAIVQGTGWGDALLARGPFDTGWLRPQALFHLDGLEPLSHGVFWSLAVNLALYVGLSMLRKPGLRDLLQAANFLNVHRAPLVAAARLPPSTASVGDLQELAVRFLGAARADDLFARCVSPEGARLQATDQLSPELARTFEHTLAGVIGASSARLVLTTTLHGRKMSPEDVVRLLDETSHTILFTRELLRTALENLPQGISVVDADLNLVAWNQRYKTLFGYPEHLVMVGRPIEDLIRFNAGRGWLLTADVERSIERRLEFMRKGANYTHARQLPDGTTVEILGNPLPGGGFVTSYSDITVYKQTEAVLQEDNTLLERRVHERTAELLELNSELARSKRDVERAHESKTRFLAAAAHDLIQPITAARLFVSSVERAPLASSIERLIDKAEGALQSAEEILAGLLDFARIDGGAQPFRPETFDLQALIQPLVDDFAVPAADKGLELRVRNVRHLVHTDQHLLRRVLQNFLSNAIRYTARGRVTIGARRRGEHVEIHVLDTGPGIPAPQQDEVFLEYRRLVDDERFAREGLGLGLSIAKRIAELLGAPIGLRSRVGRGSDFSISIPLGDRRHLPLPSTAAPAAQEAFRGVTVGIVEDELAVLEGLQALLESWGCMTWGESDAERALQSAPTRPAPDLLIVDYHLGSRLRGLDVARRLRAIWGCKVPVIVITAANLHEHHVDPGDDVIRIVRKPLKPGALRALMDVLI